MISTHRVIQLHDLADRAASERVKYYCCAIKATEISNHAAASYFTLMAQKWELIRQHATRRILP